MLNSLHSKLDTLALQVNAINAKTELAFLSQISHLPRTAQLGQDLVAYALHRGKKDGFFVDIGAHDGSFISNTLLFEKLGWQGFCVEANPQTFAKLRQNRTCTCYNLAIYSANIGTTRMISRGDGGLDTLQVNLTAAHKKRLENEISGEFMEFEVQTATFDEVMKNHPNTTHIDFLSLDVEGGELEVLKGIDFDKFSFSLMSIEHNHIKQQKREITDFLASKGYRVLMDNAWDFFFVPNEHISWDSENYR